MCICAHKRSTTRILYDISEVSSTNSYSLEDPRKVSGAGKM